MQSLAKSMLSRFKEFLQDSDEAALTMMLDPSTYNAGTSTVLTSVKEAVITESLIVTAKGICEASGFHREVFEIIRKYLKSLVCFQ